jgi:hypothetical protein
MPLLLARVTSVLLGPREARSLAGQDHEVAVGVAQP